MGIKRVERKWRGEDQKPLRMGETFEVDAESLAHRRAAAVAADQVAANDAPGAGDRLDLGFDPVVELLEIREARRERHRGMGEPAKAFDRHPRELVLLALHDERVARVVLQDAEIELGGHVARGAIPDPEFGLDQTARDDVVDRPRPSRISSVAAWVVAARGLSLTRCLGLKNLDRKYPDAPVPAPR